MREKMSFEHNKNVVTRHEEKISYYVRSVIKVALSIMVWPEGQKKENLLHLFSQSRVCADTVFLKLVMYHTFDGNVFARLEKMFTFCKVSVK